MVFPTLVFLRIGLDLPGTDVMENIDPEKVPYKFRMVFELVWKINTR